MSETIQLVLILCCTYVVTTLINKVKITGGKVGKYQAADEPRKKDGAKQ